jgi:hypothetical protein
MPVQLTLEEKVTQTQLEERIIRIRTTVHTIQEVLEMKILRQTEAQITKAEVQIPKPEAVHRNHLLQIHHLQEAIQEEIKKNLGLNNSEKYEKIIFSGNIALLWLYFKCANIRV